MKNIYSVISVSKLPSAGLGNKLFSWAAGVVFSSVNNCPHYIIGMTKFHLGPFFRNEKRKRFYFGFFKNEVLFLPIFKYLNLSFHFTQIRCDNLVTKKGNYVFSEIPHWSDSFVKLKNYNSLIKDVFWETITDNVKKRLATHDVPFIGVHIRMGDFKILKEGEDFSKLGGVRTPLKYFIDSINLIREYIGINVPVSIFSDGKVAELKEILTLPNIKIVVDDLDIVHLTLLSKSKLIIMSAGSTFSYWAGFLSEAILINHYQHIHASIRPESINNQIYEGPLVPGISIEDIPLLKTNLATYFEEYKSNR